MLHCAVIERLRSVLEADPRIAYAILFGSRGRGSAHDGSDTDLAIGFVRGARLSVTDVGEILSRLEAAASGHVDLVLLDEARPGLAYRVFRDGRVVFERDRSAFVDRKARAILEYLDFQRVEETFTHAVLGAGQHG